MATRALPFRTADPYRDTDVVDARAPRTNQAAIGVLALVAVLTGWWPILAILAAQLAAGLTFGRRYCLPCVVYFELIQPRIGEGRIEDSRPPRFANIVGLVVLTIASLCYLVGLPVAGAALGLLVAALALLAAATGLCVGCEMYRIAARIQRIKRHRLDRVDLASIGTQIPAADQFVVEFTHRLCTDCRELERRLRTEGWSVATVDVRERPDLAHRYGIDTVPIAVVVDRTGAVTARLAG